MSPRENKQTRDRDPPDLFESANPRVSLPPMSYIQGNAFAQMKAKERERQLRMSESASPEQPPRPSTGSGRRSNGLDYDQELALPMPKPRHLPPTEAELAEVAAQQRRSSSTHRTRLMKKRSGDLAAAAADSPTDSERKKSKIASLRSKFSLKDLAREFRRDTSSPPPAVPALRKSSSSGIPGTPRSVHSPPVFDEERLYVPKARNADSGLPSSAPAGTSSFQESLGGDRGSQSSMYSSPPGLTAAGTPARGDKKAEKFRHALIHDDHEDGLTTRQTQTGARLGTLLLDGSSPPAHTGELRNAGHPEVVTSGQRICSMKAEQGPTTPVKAKGNAVPPADIAREYSPSIYDDDIPEAPAPKPAVPVEQTKPATEQPQEQHPLIVSSDQKGKKAPRTGSNRPAFVSSGPGSANAQYGPGQQHQQQAFAHQLDAQMPLDEARFFTGMTSHGGFAPPPPHPGYQNTTTLEQHMTSHANSIHHHIDTALGKLARNTENNINWSTDQVIRQVETVTDMARMLNTRTVNQAELIREVQQALEYLRIQVSELQHQSFRMENKLAECVQGEMAQVRAEIRNLAANMCRTPNNTTGGWSSSHGDSQGASQSLARANKEFEKRQHSKKKARAAATVPKSEGVVKRSGSKRSAAEHTNPGECVVATSAGSLIEPGKRAEKQEQTSAAGDRGDLSERGDNNNLHSHPPVLTSTTAFCTSSLHTTEESSTAIAREIRRSIKDPRQESSGSPEPKGSKPGSSTHPPLNSLGEDPDAHKMVFGFGRSDKDKKAKKAEKKSKKDGESPEKEAIPEPKEVEAGLEEAVSKPKDNNLETAGEPKIEGEPNTEPTITEITTTTDEEPKSNESKSDTKSVKTDTKDVKCTPSKKHKKGMFSFKRNRDGGNQSSSTSGFLRTPQRHKDNKATVMAATNEPKSISQPIPIPNPPSIPHYDLYCPLPGSPEAIANYNSTEGDPAFVHPALRTPHQKAVLAERERLRLEDLARQQSAEQLQQQQSGQGSSTQDQQMGSQQHLPFGPNPLLPHHIPGTRYGGGPIVGSAPVTFRPSLSGRQQQQPAPFGHPQPPSFGQAPQAIVSHYYGPQGSNNSLATSSLTGAPNVMMPPRYQPGMPFPAEGIDMRRWYQEAPGQANPDTDGPYQADQSGQGNQPNAGN